MLELCPDPHCTQSLSRRLQCLAGHWNWHTDASVPYDDGCAAPAGNQTRLMQAIRATKLALHRFCMLADGTHCCPGRHHSCMLSSSQKVEWASPTSARTLNDTRKNLVPICLSVCLSVCLFCLSVCLYVCLSVCIYVCPSTCMFVCLFVCVLSVSLSVCLFPYVCMFVCLSVCLSVYLCVCLSVCLSVCLFPSVCPLIVIVLHKVSTCYW